MSAEKDGADGERIKRITDRLGRLGEALDSATLADLSRRLPGLNAAELDALLEQLEQG